MLLDRIPGVVARKARGLVSAVVAQATQAALEAETDEDTYAPPDLLKHHPGIAKAWLLFEQVGTQSILANNNITSIADGGTTGDTDITIATDFSLAAYPIVGTVGPGAASTDPFIIGPVESDPTAGVLKIRCINSAAGLVDAEFCSIAMFGDQA